MSTRCQVKVIQEGIWKDAVTLYHHHDGYPSNMIPLFREAYKRVGGGWEAGRAGKVASYLCEVDVGEFEPESGHTLHGDIEYYYKLFLVNKNGGSCAENPEWELIIRDIYGKKNSKRYNIFKDGLENWTGDK